MIKELMSLIFGAMVGGICSIVFIFILSAELSRFPNQLILGMMFGTIFTFIGSLGAYSIYLGRDFNARTQI